MEKITLQPGQWTPIYGTTFQVLGQEDIRIAVGHESINDNGSTVRIPPEKDAPYLMTQGYNPKVVNLTDWGFDSNVGRILYAMPVANRNVTIVVAL